MKNRLLVLLSGFILTFSVEAAAQAPTWQSAVVAQSPYSTYSSPIVIRATATDAAGNVYVAGDGDGTYTVGGLNSPGSYPGGHMFVAKWSSVTGSFVWLKSCYARFVGGGNTGGYPGCAAVAIAVSGSNVYVAGRFNADYMQFEGTTTELRNVDLGAYSTFSDVFVAKFNDNGSTATFGWAQGVGSRFNDTPTALVASSASVYLAATSALGPTMYLGTSLSLNGSGTYVAKLVDGGSTSSFAWAQPVPGTVNGMAAGSGGVVLGGAFSTPTATYGSATLASAGGKDAFVAKLADAGSTSAFAWAYGAGGNADDEVTAVAANGSSVYVTGGFASTSAGFGTTTLPASGGTDVFVAKATDAGFAWAQRAGGTGNEMATGIAANGPNVYVCGTLTGATAGFAGMVLNNAGRTDLFLTRLIDVGGAGTFSWAKQAGGSGDDAAAAVAVYGTNVYVSGSVNTPASLDNLTVTSTRCCIPTGLLASLVDATALAMPAPAWASNLVVSPNPAHTTATVHLPAGAGATSATLTLTDALGRTVRTQAVPLLAAGGTAELALAGLAPGLYQVRVQVGATQARRALAVE